MNLDQALYTWFVQMRQQGVPVSGPVLREKALRYAKEMDIRISLLPTVSSIDGRMVMTLPLRQFSGEAQSCTLEMTASRKNPRFQRFCQSTPFKADEFGLFYKALPDKSMHLKAENCVRGNAVKYA